MDNIEENNLEVSESVKSSLDTMVYWSKFLAIIGYIGVYTRGHIRGSI